MTQTILSFCCFVFFFIRSKSRFQFCKKYGCENIQSSVTVLNGAKSKVMFRGLRCNSEHLYHTFGYDEVKNLFHSTHRDGMGVNE